MKPRLNFARRGPRFTKLLGDTTDDEILDVNVREMFLDDGFPIKCPLVRACLLVNDIRDAGNDRDLHKQSSTISDVTDCMPQTISMGF